jgi:hypothetical protein
MQWRISFATQCSSGQWTEFQRYPVVNVIAAYCVALIAHRFVPIMLRQMLLLFWVVVLVILRSGDAFSSVDAAASFVAVSLPNRRTLHENGNSHRILTPGTATRFQYSNSRSSTPVVKRRVHCPTPRLSATIVDPSDSLSLSPPILLLVALALGIAANGFIQQMLQGERGLGSFLSDGAGFNKSKFQPLKADEERAVRSDPLPWLKLPRLDFVEVAGQEKKVNLQTRNVSVDQANDDLVLAKLELLRLQMTEQLALGNVAQAKALQQQMEAIMKESNIQFLSDGR